MTLFHDPSTGWDFEIVDAQVAYGDREIVVFRPVVTFEGRVSRCSGLRAMDRDRFFRDFEEFRT